MPVCVVKLCKNNTTRNKKGTGTTYHQFPTDPEISERWTAIIRHSREESWWKPGKRSIICSAHFKLSDFYFTKGGLRRLRKGAVPQNALFLSPTLYDDSSNDETVTTEPSILVKIVNVTDSVLSTEPCISTSVVNSTNGAVTEPNASAPVVNSTNSAVTAESSASFPVVNSTNSPVTAEPSASTPVVISTNSAVTAEPSTSAPDVNSTNNAVTESCAVTPVVNSTNIAVSAEPSISDPADEDNLPDLDYIFEDTPLMKLRKELRRKDILQKKHGRIIKTLREKTRRLKKANSLLKSSNKHLKKLLLKIALEQFIDNDV